MHKFTKLTFKLLDLFVIFMMVFGAPMTALAAPSPTGATIASDLADYPPGATVTLTGAGWASGESVHIVVNDTIGQTWKRDVTVTADPLGNVTDVFTLPNYFVSDYDVTASGLTSGDATTSFTDADATTNKVYQHWADAGGVEWNNNILNDNKSDYFEGEVIPHVFLYKASNQTPLTNGQSYSFNVTYNWYQSTSDAGGFAYMTTYNISRQPSNFNATTPAITPTVDNSFTNGGGMLGDFYTVDADITGVSAATYTGAPGDVDGHVTITFTYSGTTTTSGLAAIYYGLYIAKPGQVPDQGKGKTNGANAWTGGSLQTTVDIGGSGASSIQLAPSAIIAGEISGLKFNDLNGNGTKDTGEPSLAGWTICLDSDSDATNGDLGCVQTANGTTDDLDGNGTIDPVGFYYFSVTPGTYYVREVNQAGWSQTAPSSIYYGPLVVSTTTPVYLNQNFGNHLDQGYLKITKTFDPKTSGFSGTFAIVYNCGAGNVTVNLAAGGSTTVGPFSTGTVCTVSEPTLPTAPTGWTFGTASISGSPATIGNNTTVEVTVANSISRDQGYLKIMKSFDAKTSGFGGTFDIVYNCGAGNVTVSLAAGASTTVGPFDTGTSCSVSEPTLPTAPTGWTFGTPSVSGSPAPITAGDQTAAVEVTVTNSITRDQGYLKISKVFDAKTSGFNGTFDIVYNCGSGDQTVSLAAGGSTTVGPFDTGTSCTVSEPTLPTAPSGWTFGTPSVSGSPATIVKGDQTAAVAVTVTNSISRDLGSLVLAKSLDDGGSGFTGPFTIHWDCGTFGSGDESVNAGGSATISNIPTGTSCTVSEPTLPSVTGYTFGTPTFSPSATVTIPAGNASSVTVTTNNTMTRDLGNFKITKTTSNPDGATLPTFTGTYDCGTGYTGIWSVANGGSQTVTGIPTGNTCSVTEDALAPIPGYTWATPTYTPSSIVISSKGGTFEIVVGNSITRDLGNFKITKQTSNPDGATLPASFTGTYNCGTGYTGTWSVANGGSQIVTDIPTGNSCTVTEDALAPIPGYTWGTPTFTPSSIVISSKGGTFEIVVGNSITRDLGNFKITKTTSNPDGATLPAAFTGTYDCGTGYTGTWSVADGGSQTVTGIPTGNSCTVTEDALAPISGYTWGTPTFTPASIVISSKGGTFTITVGNSITRDRGSLKIYKTLSNPDGASVPASFTVDYNCGTGYTGQVSVAPGSPATVNGIPTGSTCSVTEVAPTPIPNYTWGTITYAPSSVTIDTKGGTFSITVGNSITRDRGSLTVVKKVINDNGGTATVSAFGVNSSAGSLTFDSGVANGTTTTYTSQKITVVTGNYTLKESDVYGYTEGTWSCTGAAGTVVSTFNSGSVQVEKDEDVTCTITNNDQPGTIVVQKIIKPVGSLTSFSFTTTGTGYINFSLAGGQTNTQTNLSAGSYSVKELVPLGWVLTGIGGSTDPNTPYNCTITGSGGSTGVGDLNTQIATISLKNGDTVTCVFENTGQGVTRTQGFWATHTPLANIAWFGGTAFGHTFPGVAGVSSIGNTTLCGKNIDTLGKLMGGFWSDISKTSTGAKRSSLDQARMQLLQQLLAAELNASAFGTVPSTGSFAAWETAYCTGNANTIKTAQQQAASFNTAGDSGTFTPGTSADSKNARAVANYAFWDILP